MVDVRRNGRARGRRGCVGDLGGMAGAPRRVRRLRGGSNARAWSRSSAGDEVLLLGRRPLTKCSTRLIHILDDSRWAPFPRSGNRRGCPVIRRAHQAAEAAVQRAERQSGRALRRFEDSPSLSDEDSPGIVHERLRRASTGRATRHVWWDRSTAVMTAGSVASHCGFCYPAADNVCICSSPVAGAPLSAQQVLQFRRDPRDFGPIRGTTDARPLGNHCRAARIVVLHWRGVSADSGFAAIPGAEGLWLPPRDDLATPERSRAIRVGGNCTACGEASLAVLQRCASRPGLFRPTAPNVRIITERITLPDSARARRTAPTRSGLAARAPFSIFAILLDCAFHRENRIADDSSSLASLPRCEECGALLRPDVVWFGELTRPVSSRSLRVVSAPDLVRDRPTASWSRPQRLSLRAPGRGVSRQSVGNPLTRVATVSIRERRWECGDMLAQ